MRWFFMKPLAMIGQPFRRCGRAPRPSDFLRTRLAVEELESRLTPSSYSVSQGGPTDIDLSKYHPGDKVMVTVNFTEPDMDDPGEGEADVNLTISQLGVFHYGMSPPKPLTIGQENEHLSASISDSNVDPNSGILDYDEGAATITIMGPTPTATIDLDSNVMVYNPSGPEAYSDDSVKATVTNTSDSTASFTVAIKYGGKQTGSYDVPNLAAHKTQTMTIRAAADSKSADDVELDVMYQKQMLDSVNLTVVHVTLGKAENIYNEDTPKQMLDAKAYRLPPTATTMIPITVTPTLPDDEALTLVVLPSGSQAAGSVTVTNGDSVTQNMDLQLVGGTQTMPGSAGQLMLTVMADGRKTLQSHGFSVSAIPIGGIAMTSQTNVDTQTSSGDAGSVGFIAHYNPANIMSDSGVPNDGSLNLVKFTEKVTIVGSLVGLYTKLKPDQTPAPIYYADLQGNDKHLTGWQSFFGLGTPLQTGSETQNQVYQFVDTRTNGSLLINVPNSDYQITKTVTDLGFENLVHSYQITTVKKPFDFGDGAGGGGVLQSTFPVGVIAFS